MVRLPMCGQGGHVLAKSLRLLTSSNDVHREISSLRDASPGGFENLHHNQQLSFHQLFLQ